MAVTGTYNARYNAQSIIDDALRLLGVIGPDESLGYRENDYARRVLDSLTKSWISDGMAIWAIQQKAFNLTASQGTYKIGDTQASPHFTSVAPERVLQAFRRDTNSIDIPLQLWTREQYWALPNKTHEGTPVAVWYHHPQIDTYTGTDWYGEVRIWPIPDTTAATEYDLVLIYEAPVMNLNSLDADISFPPEWHRALVWNLAADLSYTYGIALQERQMIQKKAGELHQYAMFNANQDDSLFIQPDYSYVRR